MDNAKIYGFDNNFIDILKSLYSGSSSFYCCGSIVTPNIAIKRGVRQGCPISMLLFSIFINPVLVAVGNVEIPKYQINGTVIDILAYADDIAVVATNESDLQVMVNTAIEICNLSGMKFQPGFLTDELRAAPTRLKESRMIELQALTSPIVKQAVAEAGISLVNYRQLNQEVR